MPGNTTESDVSKAKVAITIERKVLEELDEFVRQRRFVNRSLAIESAVVEKLTRLKRTRLIMALNAIDPAEEQAFAEEGLTSDLAAWPRY
ncbi:MAG: ribbon-helix-helix domain-containing protein [Trueperaceae bacterium]|nr:ribbon-helix-helix domain-containing protein [Trueperaceae bacterium]